MPNVNDCYFAVRDADFKSPIGELAQLARLISLEAERYELHYAGQWESVQIDLAPRHIFGSDAPKIGFRAINWRNL